MSYNSQIEKEARIESEEKKRLQDIIEVRQLQKLKAQSGSASRDAIKLDFIPAKRKESSHLISLKSKLRSYFLTAETWYHLIMFTCCIIVLLFGLQGQFSSPYSPVFTMLLLVDIVYRVRIISDILKAFQSKLNELVAMVFQTY